ncbi:MAG TPA: ABC transporter ATP-binding protein [Micromonosporaceae bacterium]|nr:ABC transporter ATP-binding protein [Micromonosporaceae bacterium]
MTGEPLLRLTDVRASYGRVEVVHGIDLTVADGEKVVLLGPNGAGKTTVLRAISRTVRTAGRISFDGSDLHRRDPAGLAGLGIGHVPAGRGTFSDLTVAENLRLGTLARGRRHRADRGADLARIMTAFPMLAEHQDRPAGALSGGQQQMLALARVLLGRPRLLLIDEPSLGLAPLITQDLFVTLAGLQHEWGLALLLAEQNTHLALKLADRAYVLAAGRLVHTGPADQVTADDLHSAYLGTSR